MSVNINFINSEGLTREDNGVFKFEGMPTSPLIMPRLTPLIRRPKISFPDAVNIRPLPFPSSTMTNSSESDSPEYTRSAAAGRTQYTFAPETAHLGMTTSGWSGGLQLQEGPGQKRKNVDDEMEEAEDPQIELERCVNCGTEFNLGAEHTQNECAYHPGERLTDQEVLAEYIREGMFTTYGSQASDLIWSCCDDRCGKTPGCERGEHVPSNAPTKRQRRWSRSVI